MADLLAILAVLYTSLAAHELGHLLAALAARAPITRMEIGSGPLLAYPVVRGIGVQLRLLPTGASLRYAPGWSVTDWRWPTILLAGPGAQLLFLLAVGPQLLSWVQVASLLVVAVWNLVPIRVARGIYSDGYQLRAYWRARRRGFRPPSGADLRRRLPSAASPCRDPSRPPRRRRPQPSGSTY